MHGLCEDVNYSVTIPLVGHNVSIACLEGQLNRVAFAVHVIEHESLTTYDRAHLKVKDNDVHRVLKTSIEKEEAKQLLMGYIRKALIEGLHRE